MQVLATAVVVGLVARYVCGQPGPAAIVIGNGLALSSTAVVLQVNNLSTVCLWFLLFEGLESLTYWYNFMHTSQFNYN